MSQTAPNSTRIHSLGFQAFLLTQFLGALNDNLFKLFVIFLAVRGMGDILLPLANAIFVLPFLLFSGYAGQLADRYSKRSVLITTKAMEILAMTLGLGAVYLGAIPALLGVLFLMALQSTLFSPGKYGILPEMLSEKDLSNANGWLEMTTFLAIILGTSLGGILYVHWEENLLIPAAIFVMLAVLGTCASYGIPRVPSSGSLAPFRKNPWGEIREGLSHLYKDKALWRTVIGISYFWMLGSMFTMLVLLLGQNDLHLREDQATTLWTFLAVGIGTGSLLAGKLSGEKIELGLIPFGSIGMGTCCLALYFTVHSYLWSVLLLFGTGFSSGFFIVPLNAFLQQASGKQEKGRFMATNNFLNTIAMLAASGIFALLHHVFSLEAGVIFLLMGIFSFGVTLYIARLLPYEGIRMLLKTAIHVIFKVRLAGTENIPLHGPAVLVSNHVSYWDGLLIGACVPRYMRFLVYKNFFTMRGIRWILRLMDAIPVSNESRRDIVELLRKSRETLQAGDPIVIFPEGAISRTGNLLPFQRGFEKIAEGMEVPIIPVHLDGLWGSLFSYSNGRFFWKRPRIGRLPVRITFGKPMPYHSTVFEVRQTILEMSADAAASRQDKNDVLTDGLIRQAKHRWFSKSMADSSGLQLSFGRALAVAWMLARYFRRSGDPSDRLGILLPGTVGGALANIAAVLMGKIAVNLNYTTGSESLLSAVRQCELSTIVTSRKLIEKFGFSPLPEMVFLEDILHNFPRVSIITQYLALLLTPGWILRRWVRGCTTPDSPAVILFSSGSTGEPKGVVLSHYNLISNLDAIAQVLELHPEDCMCGTLPFFHCFGLNAALWLPWMKGFSVVYHPNPLDARGIGNLVEQHHATLLLTTPTFSKGLIRKCESHQLASLRYAVSGAERLPESIAREFRGKFGLSLLQGYGCTELSPVATVNRPDVLQDGVKQIGQKEGSIGHPLPGVAAKIVHPETGKALPSGQEGILLIKGPNRMRGYWKQPELTESVFRNGWYVTGDMARMDEDGFLTITDRLSRFSKIGGEMVPHMKVESIIAALTGEGNCAVTAIPDESRGERLAVLVAQPEISPTRVWETLKQSGLPALWIPKPEDIIPVEEIPVLPTGKKDLGRIRQMALERTCMQWV